MRGPVELEALGPALMHEHIFVMDPEALQNYGSVWGARYWDEEERVADAIEKLTAVPGRQEELIEAIKAPGKRR